MRPRNIHARGTGWAHLSASGTDPAASLAACGRGENPGRDGCTKAEKGGGGQNYPVRSGRPDDGEPAEGGGLGMVDDGQGGQMPIEKTSEPGNMVWNALNSGGDAAEALKLWDALPEWSKDYQGDLYNGVISRDVERLREKAGQASTPKDIPGGWGAGESAARQDEMDRPVTKADYR